MSSNPSWNPEQYLRFADERLRPAIDLIGRLAHPGPRVVVDLGCGAGNALPLLAARFPGARVMGVDGSAAMLAKAGAAGFPTQQADIATWRPEAPVDVLFSNAALHWLPGHEALFPHLLGLLAPGGVLAVQMPAMHAAPLRALQDRVAATAPWAARLAGIRSAPPILEPGAYYDLLRPHVAALDLWLTEYVHVLHGENPVVQWAMGTSLRPYLDALPETERPAFLAAYAEALAPHYRPQTDGSVLLPFRRLFVLATRPN
ncbi:methyltransferase domain-containing protein [Roseomonas sp. GC11]|uniref:methyltransferase domain-containing protein n=1 Tax=Roseomonas sp. GC11 TaxID=2950546 RepID=UPI00210AFCB4|nr:methyltransferase domain-containing protein [Roseomonas sp. GC11]MCQ4158716.1 methyltransferase domain-containing protein [Roseomonas sp. GC11]